MEYLHHSSMITLNFHTDFISIIMLMLDVSFNGCFFVFVFVVFFFGLFQLYLLQLRQCQST